MDAASTSIQRLKGVARVLLALPRPAGRLAGLTDRRHVELALYQILLQDCPLPLSFGRSLPPSF
jgi:hypothetical protein